MVLSPIEKGTPDHRSTEHYTIFIIHLLSESTWIGDQANWASINNGALARHRREMAAIKATVTNCTFPFGSRHQWRPFQRVLNAWLSAEAATPLCRPRPRWGRLLDTDGTSCPRHILSHLSTPVRPKESRSITHLLPFPRTYTIIPEMPADCNSGGMWVRTVASAADDDDGETWGV